MEVSLAKSAPPADGDDHEQGYEITRTSNSSGGESSNVMTASNNAAANNNNDTNNVTQDGQDHDARHEITSNSNNGDKSHNINASNNAATNTDNNNMTNYYMCLPCRLWTILTRGCQTAIQRVVVQCGCHAARYPIWYVVGLTLLSLALPVIGYVTNFRLELDIEAVLSPTGSQPGLHKEWVYSQDGFPHAVREIAVLMHRQGDNVLTVDAMERLFTVVETIRETDGYDELCQQGNYVDFENVQTCRILSATGYFDKHQYEVFQEKIQSDEQLRQVLSSYEFANGAPVYHDAILGNYEKDATGNLTRAKSFLVVLFIPDIDEPANLFEEKMFARLDPLRRLWNQETTTITIDDNHPAPLHMDMLSIYSTQMEYQRAIAGDLYLIPVVAFIMCSFVGLVFFSHGWGGHPDAKSRTLLGSSSVFTITMSICCGFGIMFICGVPFTPITQILPFVIFGIGLDDTFIITGAYFRLEDPENPNVQERIRRTMEEVAHSISLTTITTMFAFLLGLRSSLPGVQWMCLYAFTTIAIDFFFQITLFVAFVTIDEWRVQANRRDICIWLPDKKRVPTKQALDKDGSRAVETTDNSGPVETVEKVAVGTEDPEHQDEGTENSPTDLIAETNCEQKIPSRKSIPERIMSRYADILLRPATKILVLLLFAALLGGCIYSTTLLKQEFRVGDFVPSDSYLKDVMHSLQAYSSVVRPMGVYFRNIDQTDPAMQEQMVNYVNELEALDQISSIEVDTAEHKQVKPFCWVRDFQQLADEIAAERPDLEFVMQNLTTIQKLNLALMDPTVREVYGQDIIRDESGNVTASRCWLFLTNIDLNSVQEQIDLLHDQREIGATQPINVDKPQGGWSFFFYDELFFYWEAYVVAVDELASTIISGVIALAVIAFVFIPHWTAVLFVTPMILMLDVNFLGMLQFMGLTINGIFYFCVLVSIGLMVDFLLHILMKYLETSPSKTRDERVKETLETMGASIMLGGLTTFLGVVPLVFSTTTIFMIVFKSFFAMVVLGLVHGLVLLPVILSLVGPTTGIRH